VKAGQSRDQAAKEIARKYPAFERLKRNASAKLNASILSWRKRISMADVPAGDQLLAHERQFLEARHHLSPQEIRAVGEELLRQAARLAEMSAV